MSPLSKEEILTVLKELGVNSDAEIDSYFREYHEYLTLNDIRKGPQQKLSANTGHSYPAHGASDGRPGIFFNMFVPVNVPGNLKNR
ncbi:MAG: hypothetical protein OEU95_04350 [Nitrospirota bacterium]|nr:hypothetical protein [Nitrospirota bacterium]